MLNTRLSVEAQNIQLDALSALADDGYIRIYSGTQPATPDDVVDGTLLAELRLSNPAFGASSAGAITANAIVDESDALATGTATWFRVLKSDGVSALWDGSVGTESANMILNSVDIQKHAIVGLSGMVHSLPYQGI